MLAEGFDFGLELFNEACLVRAEAEARSFCGEMAMDTSAQGDGRWLSLLGTQGAGKTFLAKGIKRFFLERARHYRVAGKAGEVWCGRVGRFWDWRRCADRILSGEWDLAEAIIEDWFAVIDDVGTVYDPSGLLAAKLDFILNSRLGKWTVVTSNYSLDEIGKKLDVRIASRLIRGRNVVVRLETTDYALRVRKPATIS